MYTSDRYANSQIFALDKHLMQWLALKKKKEIKMSDLELFILELWKELLLEKLQPSSFILGTYYQVEYLLIVGLEIHFKR